MSRVYTLYRFLQTPPAVTVVCVCPPVSMSRWSTPAAVLGVGSEASSATWRLRCFFFVRFFSRPGLNGPFQKLDHPRLKSSENEMSNDRLKCSGSSLQVPWTGRLDSQGTVHRPRPSPRRASSGVRLARLTARRGQYHAWARSSRCWSSTTHIWARPRWPEASPRDRIRGAGWGQAGWTRVGRDQFQPGGWGGSGCCCPQRPPESFGQSKLGVLMACNGHRWCCPQKWFGAVGHPNPKILSKVWIVLLGSMA